jgi:Uncharacterized protein conserved in bacteria with an aminopeptidase-like domain
MTAYASGGANWPAAAAEASLSRKMMDFIAETYRFNRTIVSKDIPVMLDRLAQCLGWPLTTHAYPSGADIATWVVPDRWDVREAWLKGPDGTLLASYADHPLFVAPYSAPFRGRLSLDLLKKHLRIHPTQRDAFFYEHRLAYDFQRRLKEWIITLPQDVADRLPAGEYEVCIDVEVEPGKMLVGEFVLPGQTEDTILLMTDYCHPGQVNDSLSGLMAVVLAVNRLLELPERRYTYRMMVFPETIGSCIFLASHPELIGRTKFALFSEFVGWGETWVLAAEPDPASLAWKLCRDIARRDPACELRGLFGGWGNDEMVTHYAGIQSLAVQKVGCPEYHSSNDHPSRLDEGEIRKAAEIIASMCRIAEADRIPQRTQPVPIYLTRYNLYKDAVFDSRAYAATRDALNAVDGQRSILDIAVHIEQPFDTVANLMDRLEALGLFTSRPS